MSVNVPKVRYFLERSFEEMNQNNDEWNAVKDRMIFLQPGLPPKHFLQMIKKNLNKDIVGIKFPSKKWMSINKNFKALLAGECLVEGWSPKEIWIYTPL